MSKKDSVDALAEIKIDPTSYQSESVPPSNDLRSLDKVEHVKCVVNAPRHSCEGVIMRLNKRKAWQRRLQIALLCVILVIFWGLSAIPIVSYHLSTEPAQSLASNSSVQLGSSADGSADAGRDSSVNCSTIRCSDGFYCTLDSTSNRNICRPRCDTWEENPEADVAFGAVSGIAAVIGLTTGVAALIIACIRRGKVLTFPSVLPVYLNIEILVYVVGLALLFIITEVDSTDSELFCSSLDLQESLENATPFCTFTGVAIMYVQLQIVLWAFIHVVALFWRIKFPIHSRSFEIKKRIKYIHIAAVVLAFILPAVPLVVFALTGGYEIAAFPPRFCWPRSQDSFFYSINLPIIIALQIGAPLLLTIFWAVHKQHGLFRANHSRIPFNLGTAQKKILISFCYYFILTVFFVALFTLLARDVPKYRRERTNYFECEAQGLDTPCNRTYLEFTHLELGAVYNVLTALLPVFNLVYLISFQDLKQSCSHHCHLYSPNILHRPSTSVSVKN